MRKQRLEALKSDTIFDLLVIGGGASGCGIAADAASRGLSVALVDRQDLAEGTSSRSTKLVHGGVRYLEKAVKNFDRAQYRLVKEALSERGTFLKNAPHLAFSRALVTPLYNWFEVPYVFAGLVMYDILAGKKGLGRSALIGRKEALARFPMLKSKGLKAGVIYYDGQFNDARMAVSLALTAEKHGAVIANHVGVTGLLKTNEKLSGAQLRDMLSGEEFAIKARGVINATGTFVDQLRQMDDPACRPIIKAASGIHITLPKHFVPVDTGLLIPKTEDGRVLFILPWQGFALVGTTDSPAEIVDHPKAQEEEIAYILRHINRYFDLNVTREDVCSTWCGLRPLVENEDAANTEQLVREHLILTSKSGLLTLAGGKWTSYRQMAEETVDQATQLFALKNAKACQTKNLPVVGAETFNPTNTENLVRNYALPIDIAAHLHGSYGDRAEQIAILARENKLSARLCEALPYIEAEVIYILRHEFADRLSDVITRRLPLALLNVAATKKSLPRVLALMAAEIGWDEARQNEEIALALERLNSSI